MVIRYLGLIAALMVCAEAEPVVEFPGAVTEVVAPNTGLKLAFVDPGAAEQGGHDYSLNLTYPDGRSEEVTVFTRSIEVGWSPSGQAFFLTNHIGTNTADCYVVTPAAGAAQKISLTDVITQGKFPAPLWALQHSSHGAVICDGWLDADKIHFVLQGDGGDTPNGFHYAFIYDAARGTAKLDRPTAAAKKKKRAS